MQTSFQEIKLRDGGTVAVSEYGAQSGAPIFFCHGWPSSRTMAELTDTAARKLNLRIISPDRPGIRDSSLQPERKLIDWPPHLAELAAKMGIGEFRILGISGGAPYALAAAWAMPFVAGAATSATICWAPSRSCQVGAPARVAPTAQTSVMRNWRGARPAAAE